MLLRNRARTALRFGLSVALLVWLASQVQWRSLGGVGNVSWTLAAPAIALAGIAYPLQAWRWQVLLRAQGLMPPARWTHGVFWIAQFYNSFLPSGVGGDAVRFGYLWQRYPDRKTDGAASLIADRLLGLGVLFALAALALGLHLSLQGGGVGLQTLLISSVAAFALLLAAGWSVISSICWGPISTRVFGTERAAKMHLAAVALARQHAALAAATWLSVAVWLVDFASLWLLARSVGLSAGPLEMTVAAAAAYVAAALPISVGGHGVREGALLAVLTQLGLGAGQTDTLALLALLFWTVSVGWSLAGGALYLTSLLIDWPLAGTTARRSSSQSA